MDRDPEGMAIHTTVPARVWAVASAPGGAYPANAARVNAMITEANKILRQVAMKITWDGTLSTTNRADWYDLTSPTGACTGMGM